MIIIAFQKKIHAEKHKNNVFFVFLIIFTIVY